MFENVDGRRRKRDHGYTISSPSAQVSQTKKKKKRKNKNQKKTQQQQELRGLRYRTNNYSVSCVKVTGLGFTLAAINAANTFTKMYFT